MDVAVGLVRQRSRGQPRREGRGEGGRGWNGGDESDRADERGDDVLGHHLPVHGCGEGRIPHRKDEQHGQRGAHIGEDECVHGRGDVVAPDGDGSPEEEREALRRVCLPQGEHRRSLAYGYLIQHSEGRDHAGRLATARVA